jgi:hypothetical protein
VTRLVALCAYLLALNSCNTFHVLHPLVHDQDAVAEPRLVGTWELIFDDDDTLRVVVASVVLPIRGGVFDCRGKTDTPQKKCGSDSSVAYTISYIKPESDDSIELVGRLGPFDGDRWVLDLTPSGPVAELAAPYGDWFLSTYFPVIVTRDSTGLGFAVFDPDFLVRQVGDGLLQTPYVWLNSGWPFDVLLTASGQELLAALRDFARHPEALITLPVQGRQIDVRD